jgi:general secretion pathway protein K
VIRSTRPPYRRRQRGAALLAAMLTVTLVATLAAAALWQQWRSVEVEAAERVRVQSAWILTGALDWGRLILREDARTGGADHLGEPWATSLEESRLSTFLAAEKGVSQVGDDARDAFLSGQISDQQARMNVFNLVQSNALSPLWMDAFRRLFVRFGLPTQELDTVAENLRFASDHSTGNLSGALAAPWPQRLPDLQLLGMSRSTLRMLEPYITLLPTRTPVNLNTASPDVVLAMITGLDAARAQQLMNERGRSPLTTLDAAAKTLGLTSTALNADLHAVSSRYFEVRGRLRLDQIALEERSLVRRDGLDVQTLWRERVSLTLR